MVLGQKKIKKYVFADQLQFLNEIYNSRLAEDILQKRDAGNSGGTGIDKNANSSSENVIVKPEKLIRKKTKESDKI